MKEIKAYTDYYQIDKLGMTLILLYTGNIVITKEYNLLGLGLMTLFGVFIHIAMYGLRSYLKNHIIVNGIVILGIVPPDRGFRGSLLGLILSMVVGYFLWYCIGGWSIYLLFVVYGTGMFYSLFYGGFKGSGLFYISWLFSLFFYGGLSG